jgi:hypothetical protein
MKDTVIFDGRNLYDPTKMKEFGITYHSVGRAPIQNLKREELYV